MESGYISILKLLLAYSSNAKETLYRNALLYVHCDSKNPDLLKFLAQRCGLEINVVDQYNNIALHCAAVSQSITLVRALLDLGASPTCVNNGNEIALHCVAKCVLMEEKPIEIAKRLIATGTQFRQQDNFSGTILHIAALENHIRLAELLLARDLDSFDIESTRSYCRGKRPLGIAKSQDNVIMASILYFRCQKVKVIDT